MCVFMRVCVCVCDFGNVSILKDNKKWSRGKWIIINSVNVVDYLVGKKKKVLYFILYIKYKLLKNNIIKGIRI